MSWAFLFIYLFFVILELTVGTGLKLETGAAGSVSGSGAGSDLQQVGRVGLQPVQGHVTTPGTEDGVTGLLLLLQDNRQTEKELIRFIPLVFSLKHKAINEYNKHIQHSRHHLHVCSPTCTPLEHKHSRTFETALQLSSPIR